MPSCRTMRHPGRAGSLVTALAAISLAGPAWSAGQAMDYTGVITAISPGGETLTVSSPQMGTTYVRAMGASVIDGGRSITFGQLHRGESIRVIGSRIETRFVKANELIVNGLAPSSAVAVPPATTSREREAEIAAHRQQEIARWEAAQARERQYALKADQIRADRNARNAEHRRQEQARWEAAQDYAKQHAAEAARLRAERAQQQKLHEEQLEERNHPDSR